MAYAAPSVTSSGFAFSDLQAKGVTGLLEKLISVNTTVTAAPTAAPTGVAASGGTLPNATYYFVCTETNGFGETTASPASTGVAANNQKITVTFPSPRKTGNTATNVYGGTSASGPFTLVVKGQTGTTYDVTALPTDSRTAAQPPTTNTAGMANIGAPRKISFTHAAEKGNLQDVYRFLASIVSAFNAGKPIDTQEIDRKLNDVHVPIALLNQLCTEVGTLLDANRGSIKNTSNGAGVSTTVRQWP